MLFQSFIQQSLRCISAAAMLLCFLFVSPFANAGSNKHKDAVLIIPFGKDGRIEYALQKGTYDVWFHDKKVISNAYSVIGGKLMVKSTQLGKATYSSNAITDAFGKGKLYRIIQSVGNIRMEQLFYVYPGQSYFFTQVKVYGKEVAAGYISPLTSDELFIEGKDQRGLVVPFDNDMWVRFDVQTLPSAEYTSSEVTALYDEETHWGTIIGSVEHTVWKSGIKVKSNENKTVSLAAFGGLADSNITHDKIPHGAVSINDTLCSSPKIMVGQFDDWCKGMNRYAGANHLTEPPVIARWKKATPMGWNSWGVIQSKITLDKAKAVVDFFSDSCRQFRNEDGTLFIDLDSFWDNMVKGGIDGDVSALQTFVDYCKKKKLQPGIYWAPFTDWGKTDRKIEGSNYTYPDVWIKQNNKPVELDGALAMDPTHPGTRARIVKFLNRFKALGFEMIKIDFLGHAALESDHYFDPHITTGMQAYASGMQFVDSVLNNSMLVYAAISPSMATARYVHMRRIGCDAFSAIDNTEYTLNSTGYGWWQRGLYQYIDADHVVFKEEKENVNRARLASALVTGTLITGDDFSATGKWIATAKQLLQNKELLRIVKNGEAFWPVATNPGKAAINLFVRYNEQETYLAVFNYSDHPRVFTIDARHIGIKKGATMRAKEIFSRATSTASDILTIKVPPADVLLFHITRQ